MTTAEQLELWHQEDLERLKGFRLMDDDFLTKCFEEDPKYIQFVLRIILEMPELEVIEVHIQKLLANLLDHSVRVDVLATDSEGRRINVEVQRESKGAGRKRARYNSSLMDADILRKGDDYKELPDTYVIFITERDVLGKGEPIYHIERYILETGEIFHDGSHIIYVNGTYRDESPIGRLMHDFSCADPNKMHYDVLAERVRFFKENEEGVESMCKAIEEMRDKFLEIGEERGLKKGREEGREEGRKEEREETALIMLQEDRYSLEEIVKMTRLSLDEVKRLKEAGPLKN